MKKILFFISILINGFGICNLALTAETPKTNKGDSRCFVFPTEQTVKVHESRKDFLTLGSEQSGQGKFKIFLVSETFPSFIHELFSLDKHLIRLNPKDQWSYHKFRFSKHLLKAHIQSSIIENRKYDWELQIISPKQLISELSDSEDLAHAIIFLHGDDYGCLFGYDGQKLSFDSFSKFAPCIQSICIAACYLSLAVSRYSIRENFLNTANRFFIEAMNDEYDEFRVDNAQALIKKVEEAIEYRKQNICEHPGKEVIER